MTTTTTTHTYDRTPAVLDRMIRAARYIEDCDMEHAKDDLDFAFKLEGDAKHLRKIDADRTALLDALAELHDAINDEMRTWASQTEQPFPGEDDIGAAMNKARAAIAQATGEDV